MIRFFRFAIREEISESCDNGADVNIDLTGLLGAISMLILSIGNGLHLVPAVLALMAGSAGVAVADVTIDACITENSSSHPALASDMQSLCGLSSSIGALAGFIISGFLVHLVGSKVCFWSYSSKNLYLNSMYLSDLFYT